MPNATFEIVAGVLLVLCLVAVVARPFHLGTAVVGVVCAGLLVAIGATPAGAAGATVRELAPTVGFLAAILVFGHLCAGAGLFDYLGALTGRAARDRPIRMLTVVVALAAATAAVLTLDATVVLLTPVVLAAASGEREGRRVSFACVRIANSGSLLLPVSNLTNLLAFSAATVSFGRFAELMALPWVVVVAGEWLVARVGFRGDLVRTVDRDRVAVAPGTDGPPADPPAPGYALVVAAGTVAGFVVCSSLHIAIAWAALAGCLALLLPRSARRGVTARRLLATANIGFCVFVLALAVVVGALVRHGLGSALGHVLPAHLSSAHMVPGHVGLTTLLIVAFVAAGLAAVVNNLPATLALIPLLAGDPGVMLAMLIGVNVGPNLVYSGSLANLLWRRVVPGSLRPSARQFHLSGLATVPPLLCAGCAALWVALRVVG